MPRDGRNLTVPLLVEKLDLGLNVSPETAAALAASGLTLSADPSTGAFDLDDLNKHNAIEHDGSLSRKDIDLGGNEKFSKEVFDQTIRFYGGATEIGFKEVAAARWGRIQNSRATNPKFTYGPGQRFGSHFESSAYHRLLQNPETEKARLDWIKIFFCKPTLPHMANRLTGSLAQERLPYNEGWRPVNRIDGFSTARDFLKISLLTPEKASDLTTERA